MTVYATHDAAETASAQQGHRNIAEMNITPLVDVMLVLLVIFMIAAPLMSPRVRVDLPHTERIATRETAPPRIAVAVTESGETYLNDIPMDRGRLEDALLMIAQHEPQPVLNVRGDRATQYRHINDVVALAQKQGFKEIAFVSIRERE